MTFLDNWRFSFCNVLRFSVLRVILILSNFCGEFVHYYTCNILKLSSYFYLSEKRPLCALINNFDNFRGNLADITRKRYLCGVIN